MKKYISLLLALLLLSSTFSLFGVNASATFPEIEVMNGYENLCLTYTWNPDRADNGRHTVDDLMPYVAYYDTNRQIKDFFFDSYLFLPCVKAGETGASLHYGSSNPTKALDWTSYIEDTFYEGANVDALDTAFGNAKTALNAPDKKAGVFFTILYPGRAAGSSFGSLGGRALDFSNIDDRKYAIKWMIDEQVRLFTEAGYENLDLIGFYWLEEYVYTSSDKQLFQYASEYLHSLGLKFLWIPYYSANGYSTWKELGFDIACYQPNMYWQSNPSSTRVSTCVRQANSLGMCVEMEIDHNALSNTDHYNRYLDYLEGAMNGGAMDSIKMYYQGGKEGTYYAASRSTHARARSIYDITYKYAKGTLTQADIDAMRDENATADDPFTLPEGVDWVSVGKSYVATKPYSDGSGAQYQQNDGKELTDGVLGTTELGTDWHAYHVSNLDADRRMSVTIDLGEVRDDLTDFLIQFSHLQLHGIGDPADDIKIYISEDGTSYRLLAEPSLEFQGYTSYIHYETSPVTARYVTYSFINSNYNFVFCGEALVGVSDNPKEDTSEPDTSTPETSEPEVSEPETSEPEISQPDFVTNGVNVAFEKTYSGAEVSPVGKYYSANLTDGKASDALVFDSNWFGFYYNKGATADKINAPDGLGTVVIDLNEVVGNIIAARVHVWNCNSSGIAPAKSIKLYSSENGLRYTEVGSFAIPSGNAPAWATITLDNISARYVKVVLETQDTWTFLNEIEVYADKNSAPTPPETSDPETSAPGGDTSSGDTSETGEILYTLSADGTYYIVSGYTGTLTDVVIPETYKDLPVKEIGESAFFNCQDLVRIELPESITRIRSYAFEECINLNEINLPKTLERIDNGAFIMCVGLDTIEIPLSVTVILDYAFYNCFAMTDIYCEAEAKPDTWADAWNEACDATVHWGHVIEPEVPDVVGDVDDDGDVDAADYVLIKRAVLKTYTLTDEQKAFADIDGDNDVDVTDYILIKRIVIGTYKVK